MLHPPHLTGGMAQRNILFMHLNSASLLPLYMDSFSIAMLFACQCGFHGDQDVLKPCVAQVVH